MPNQTILHTTYLSEFSQASWLNRAFRSVQLALHLLLGFAIALTILPIANTKWRNFIISLWSKGLLAVLDIRLVTHGTLPNRDLKSAMFVANHVSWIDIFALNSVCVPRFIAKSEIRDWPIFGWLCEKSNTLFIERTKRQEASRITKFAASRLCAGDCLCFFPEGGTSDGTMLKPFNTSLFQAAIEADSPIWPVAIHYPKQGDDINTEMAYVDDMSLLQSLKQILAQRAPVVELHFLPSIKPLGQGRRDLSKLTRQAIATSLNL